MIAGDKGVEAANQGGVCGSNPWLWADPKRDIQTEWDACDLHPARGQSDISSS